MAMRPDNDGPEAFRQDTSQNRGQNRGQNRDQNRGKRDYSRQFDRAAAAFPEIGTDPESVRKRVEAMEMLLERSFVIPGINRPVGLDSIVGLIPVVGDVITAVMGSYIVWEARNLGMSKFQITRMAANIGFDTLIGAIPLAGDLFDFFWRSNSKNLRIIRKHLDKHHPSTKIIEG